MQTIISKNIRNERTVETTAMLDKNLRLQLTLYTSKGSNGTVRSNASVDKLNEAGDCRTHLMFIDFNHTYLTEKSNRVTEKVLVTQHSKVDFTQVFLDARKFYKLPVWELRNISEVDGYLVGDIYGRDGFPAVQRVRTSPVVDTIGNLRITESGSVYKLVGETDV